MELLCNNTGNWEIYRDIDLDSRTAFIYRIPKGRSNLHKFISNHHLIKDLGLPTLMNLELVEISQGKALKVEDVNYEKPVLYVSYNSIPSKEARQISSCNPYSNIHNKNTTFSEYEEYRYKNPLDEILDLDQFLKQIRQKLEYVSMQRVTIDFDAYFFGTIKKSKISPISYKILDFDLIEKNDSHSINEILDHNLSEFSRALRGFINYFVVPENQEKHLTPILSFG